MSAPPGAGAIRFGTSGWRGILADEITLPRLRRLAAAVARWLDEERGRARVLVGHDTRFLGPRLADEAAAVLAARGHRPARAAVPLPTPIAAHAVRRGRYDAALVCTASHNPPAYQGVKVLGPWGGGVSDAEARRIEALAREADGAPLARARRARAAGDPVGDYLETLTGWIDVAAVRRTAPVVIYDALHGAAAAACAEALRRIGARVEVLHAQASPRFGGDAPDPTRVRLASLAARVRARGGAALGLATDGDGDRYAVVDADGRLLSESEALALLVDRLARTGRARRGVAISIATGSLVERVARAHGLGVARHPIGFKHLTAALAAGAADVAGEESGGFAADAIARDKDGILACALFVEIAAAEGLPLRRALQALMRRHGASACGRCTAPGGPEAAARLAALVAAPPERVDGQRVQGVETRDGLRLALADGFLMVRASGTEPLCRVYAEAPSRSVLARRLAAGRALLAAGRGPGRGRGRGGARASADAMDDAGPPR